MDLAEHLLETCRLKKAGAKGKQREEAQWWETRILSLIEANALSRKKRRVTPPRVAPRTPSTT